MQHNELFSIIKNKKDWRHCKSGKLSDSHKGQVSWNKGKHHTEASRKKMSEAHKGVRHTEETKRKMSETRKGKHWKLVDGKRVYY